MKTGILYRRIAGCAGLLAAGQTAAAPLAIPVYSGPVAMSLPPAAPAVVWALVLGPTLICVLWLLALILRQPRLPRPRPALSQVARIRRGVLRWLTVPVVFG